MMKFITALGASAVLAMGFMSSAQAGPVGGSQHAVDNSCFIIWWFFVNTDCSYDNSRAAFVPPGAWKGPINLYSYYLPGGQAAGAGVQRLRQDGVMTVTGNSGAGDVIDATFTTAAGERFGSCGQGGNCLVAWDSVTHTISAAADRATANAAGGYTYEVARNAFPARLEPCTPYIVGAPFPPGPANQLPFGCNPAPNQGWNFANQLYPSVTASPAFPFAAIAWQAPVADGRGVASFEGGRGNRNIGTTSSTVVTGYSCTPTGTGNCAATSVLGGGASFNYDNVLMKVDTNAAGGIINAEISYTQEYVLVAAAFGDSWDGNWINMSGFVAERAGGPETQVDKKGVVSITLYGTADLDVHSIDPASLQLGNGLFYTMETYGSETHGKAHYGDFDGDGNDDLQAHFRSNESDLRCGQNEIKVNGTSDGVAFSTTVTITGIGKACS